LYYFLNKKTNNKIALFRNEDERQTEVFDAQDARKDLEYLRENFPNQTDLIDDLTGVGEFVKKLREYSRGVINSKELEKSDPAILEVIPKDPLGQSQIIIDFKNDDNFFKLFDVSEDDIWFMNAISSYYSDYEFIDSYTVEQDWKEGYIVFGDLNDENKEKLQQIAELILPSKEFNLQDDEYRQELAETLLDLFERETDNILSDYFVEKNREMTITARNSINEEINKVLESSGFRVKRGYDEFVTTAANLIMWSVKFGINKTDIISLFKQIVENNGGSMGGWAEDQYEYQDYENFDSESFNREVDRQLNNILEKIEDDGTQINEFIDLRKRILSKYKMDTWFELPKDKSIKFKIKNFDRDDMKIVVLLNKQFKSEKTLSLTEEQFNYLLYQPELFDLFGEV
jgi:hypothetical protein